MRTIKLPIKGLGYHDFEGRLDELYELAPGKRMVLSVEEENEAEMDAVIAYLGTEHVGYVRSSERLTGLKCIEASGRGAIMSRVVDVDRKGRVLWVEVMTDADVEHVAEEEDCWLKDWEYDGEVLVQKEDEVRLNAMCEALEMLVQMGEVWCEEMEEYLVYIEENAWKDISRELRRKLESILRGLTEGNGSDGYAASAMRVQYTLDCMGNDDARGKLVKRLEWCRDSSEMDFLLKKYGEEEALESVGQVPQVLMDLWMKNKVMLIGRMWYLRVPRRKVRALLTLLCMSDRLSGGDDKGGSVDVPEKKLMELPNSVVRWIRDDARCTNLLVTIIKEKVLPLLGRKAHDAKWAHVLKVLIDLGMVNSISMERPKAFGDLIHLIVPTESSENVVKGVTNHKDKLPDKLFRRFDDNDINKSICESIADAFEILTRHRPKEED